jgi:hypothetical protein
MAAKPRIREDIRGSRLAETVKSPAPPRLSSPEIRAAQEEKTVRGRRRHKKSLSWEMLITVY